MTRLKYSHGPAATSACPQSELAQAIINAGYDEAKKVLKWYLDIFGEDFYLEIQRHNYTDHAGKTTIQEIKNDLLRMADNEKTLIENITKLSREFGIPIVATNDAHYISKDDATAQDALVCVATGKNVSDIKRLRYIDMPDFYLKSPEEMAEDFIDLPEVVENTQKIVNKCELEIALGTYHFPKIVLKKGETPENKLKEESLKGITSLYGKITPLLQERFEFEYKVITEKKY